MQYPTLEEVNNASHEQICRWYRFLPTPKTPDMKESFTVLNRICERLKEFGGFTPEISKKLDYR